jgi:hypothetical protein
MVALFINISFNSWLHTKGKYPVPFALGAQELISTFIEFCYLLKGVSIEVYILLNG